MTALSAKPIQSEREAGNIPGYDTSHDTKRGAERVAALEVIEKMVGPWGLEPQTSTVSR